MKVRWIVPTYKEKIRKDETVDRSSMISTHTGKKTFVMLCVKEGIDVSKVAAITGNNPQSLKQYYDLGVVCQTQIFEGS